MSTSEARATLLARLDSLPALLEQQVAGLTLAQLTAHPLEGEWSVAQIVHHIADSHLQGYLRTKLILTEEQPAFKLYSQPAWGATADATSGAIVDSLAILRGVHERWMTLLLSLSEESWARTGIHPERDEPMSLDALLRVYGNHGQAHREQIRRVLDALRT
jgi:hypothetical protein